MALSLALSYEEQNDNKLLTVTDVTTNWGNPELEIAAITALTLDITITTSDGTETVYDQLDLYTLGSGPFASQDELTWDIDASMLEVSGVALGTADDELPDGIWAFVYAVNTDVATLTESVLIDGRVRVAVYELLRVLPTIYNCTECKSKQVLDAIYSYSLLNVLQSNAYIAKTEEIISLLYTLERIITNGSNYTW